MVRACVYSHVPDFKGEARFAYPSYLKDEAKVGIQV